MERLINTRVEPPVSFKRDSIRNRHFSPEGERKKDTAELIIGKLELEKLGKIVEVLEHPNLQELINEGKITLGAIKPRVHESKLGVDNDTEAEQILLKMIDPSLEIVFSISLAPKPEDVEGFYPDEVKERLKTLKGEEDKINVWDSFKTYMLTGPVTYFLLYSEDGNAVDKWRKQMGATNPLKAKKGTIRGNYAFSIRQNMVHGSSGDNPKEKIENVTKETAWLRKKVKSVYEELTLASGEHDLTEEFARETGMVREEEELISIESTGEFTRSGYETFLKKHRITFLDASGEMGSRLVAQKAIVTLSSIEVRIKDRVEKSELLRSKGVKTPRIYGTKGGDIFEEYIEGERPVSEAINIIKSNSAPREVRINLLSQLVEIAKVLDECGFAPVGLFYDNLLFNGKDLYFVDTGTDLGSPNPRKKNTFASEQLAKVFKDIKI